MEERNDILKKIGNENPFSVPENYFEDFAQKMQKKIKKEEPSKKTIFMSRTAILFSAAATLVVALFAANAIFGTKKPADIDAQQTMIAAEQQETNYSWIAYLDESTQIENFVSNFEDENADY